MYTTYLAGNGRCVRGWLRGWGLLWGFDTLGKGGIYQSQECAEKEGRTQQWMAPTGEPGASVRVSSAGVSGGLGLPGSCSKVGKLGRVVYGWAEWMMGRQMGYVGRMGAGSKVMGGGFMG